MMNNVPIIYYDRKQKMKDLNNRLRNSFDPFDVSDRSFLDMYRMTKPLARQLINEIEEFDDDIGENPNKIPLTLQVMATLNFLGCGSFQKRIGRDAFCTMSQSSVSLAIRKVCTIISTKLSSKYIQFPTTLDDAMAIKHGFFTKYGIPGIVGLIDGTHVAISHLPKGKEYAYVNRKNFKSVNVQRVCDSDMSFTNVNARYPGSTHDSIIWRSSVVVPVIKDLYEHDQKTWLFGDSGYSLQPYMMVPFKNHGNITEEQQLFNDIHAKVRCVVERAFGCLKSRWRCLLHSAGYLHYSHERAMDIIYSCFVLHNFLIAKNYCIDGDLEEIIYEDFGDVDLPQPSENDHGSREFLVQFIAEQWTEIAPLFERRT